MVSFNLKPTNKSDLNNISLINFSKRNRTIKHDRLLLTYLYNLLLLNSYAPEPNPGACAVEKCCGKVRHPTINAFP
jgi:hypothetical protein